MRPSILEGHLNLSSWYLNTRRLSVIMGARISPDAQITVVKNSDKRVFAFNHAELIAERLLLSDKIPILTKEYVNARQHDGRILAGIWNLFTFRGMQKALKADRAAGPPAPAEMYGDIPLGNKIFEAEGKLYTEHVCSASSADYLSGRKKVYVVGQFDFDESARRVDVTPIVIGELIDLINDALFDVNRWPKRARVYPGELDCFAKLQDVRPPTTTQLRALEHVSEGTIKHAFARIIGETFVPKDWGGEKSDLYTSRVTLDSRTLSTAFLLKGPAIFHPMHPSDLGKRGDQIVRLFDEPAELLILQHCHHVMPSVIRQLEAFAVNPTSPRLYCVIDGADTYRILKAYNELPG